MFFYVHALCEYRDHFTNGFTLLLILREGPRKSLHKILKVGYTAAKWNVHWLI